MNRMRRFYENVRIIPMLHGTWPASATDQTWIDMRHRHRIAFFAQLAVAGVDGTVVLKVRQAKDASGTDAKDLVDGTEKAEITETSLVGTTEDTLVWVGIEVEAAKMDINNGFTHLTVEPAETATGDLSGVIMAIDHVAEVRPVEQPDNCKELVYFDG